MGELMSPVSPLPRQEPIPCIPTIATIQSMDDLYENAWGDPLKDYSNQSYPLPTWNAQPSSPKLPSPVEDDRNDINVNDDENEDLTTETQPRVGASGASWTADAAPWPVEENQNPFNPAWMSPANVWSSTGQPSTPTLSTPTPDDVPPQLPPLTPPTHPEEQSSDYLIPSQQAQDTPVQSRVPSPDQFGTFESGNADATIPVEVGWNSSEYSTFGGSVDPSDAWGQQAAAKAQNVDAEPVDEWEAARRMKEKLDRRVVRVGSYSFCDLLIVHLSPRRLLRASSKPLNSSPRRCGQKDHRAFRNLKRSGFRVGDAVLIASKACTWHSLPVELQC